MSQPKKQKSEHENMQDFINKYQKLCEEHGFQINVVPAFKARDDGTWSVVLQSSVGKIPMQEK